jgi:hypothetical protein
MRKAATISSYNPDRSVFVTRYDALDVQGIATYRNGLRV